MKQFGLLLTIGILSSLGLQAASISPWPIPDGNRGKVAAKISPWPIPNGGGLRSNISPWPIPPRQGDR